MPGVSGRNEIGRAVFVAAKDLASLQPKSHRIGGLFGEGIRRVRSGRQKDLASFSSLEQACARNSPFLALGHTQGTP